MPRFLYKVLFIFTSFTALSQSFTFRNYNVNEGLPSSQTYDIIQDRNKYIWIASDRGVSRFDGYTFTNYTSENGLLDNHIFNIYEDRFGRIWFLSYCGKLSYYYNGTIHPFKYNKVIAPDPKKTKAPIRSFSVLNDSSLLIGTMGDGAFHVSNAGKKKDLSYPSEYNFHYFLQNTNDHYLSYFGHKGSKTENAMSIILDNKTILKRRLNKNQIKNAFFLKRKNNHIIYSASGFLIDIYNNKIVDSLSVPTDVISLYEDSDSCLWIGYLGGGIHKFAPNTTITSVNPKIYFTQNQITKVFEDYEHGFWFTTLYNGVIYVPDARIENVEQTGNLYDPEKKVSLATDYRSKVFIGTNTGHIKIIKGGINLVNELQTKGYVKTMYYDSIGKKLFINNNTSIFVYDRNQLKEVNTVVIGLSFERNKKGEILAGYYNGIIEGYPNPGKATILNKDEIVRVEAMCYDNKGQLWVGSYNGLYYAKGNELIKKSGHPLLNYRITSMTFINNVLYIGTVEKGIVKLNGTKIDVLNIKNGLPSNIINDLEIENDSILWVATSKGAGKFNVKTEKLLFTLNGNKGLCSNDVKGLKFLNDTLYLLTNDGVSFLRPHLNYGNSTAPVIYIQDVKVDTISYIQDTIPAFNHSRNYITFNVTGLNFKQAGSVTYKYRLKGYSEQWRTTSSNNIQLAFVPPGSYTFEVVAENEDGISSLHPAIFKFKISEPLWKRLWFQLLVAFSGILVVLLIFYYRLKRIREKNKIMEQLANYKQQALTMQMNPHFIFNLLSSIQSYVLSENSLKASKYLSMFAKLMRKSLEHSRQEFVRFEEEIEILNLYVELEKTRMKKELSFIVDFKGEEFSNYKIPSMLIQPHIENAIKHGMVNSEDPNIIRLSFFFQNKLLYCKLEDNGIGIDETLLARQLKKNLHESVAIELTRSRLELLCLNQKLPFVFSISDKKHLDTREKGTIVEFILPYVYEPESHNS